LSYDNVQQKICKRQLPWFPTVLVSGALVDTANFLREFYPCKKVMTSVATGVCHIYGIKVGWVRRAFTNGAKTMSKTESVWQGNIYSGGWIGGSGGTEAVIEPATGDTLGSIGVADKENWPGRWMPPRRPSQPGRKPPISNGRR
jgi:hypothetical protein